MIQQIKIRTDSKDVSVSFKETDESWKVNTEKIDGKGWRDYAVPEADRAMVEQLLRKEYDVRY